MEAEIRDQIKEKLLTRKSELESELDKLPTQVNEQGEIEAAYVDVSDDEDINAQETSSYADNVSIVAELSKQLKDVNKSLEKIESGDYGTCKYCKKEINPQRLLARPDSGSCINCKSTLQGENK